MLMKKPNDFITVIKKGLHLNYKQSQLKLSSSTHTSDIENKTNLFFFTILFKAVIQVI